MKSLCMVAILGLMLSASVRAAEKGLVLHYTFDEGRGAIARDTSGRNNHGAIKGGAEFVKLADAYALKFDGKDDFVDCGADPSLAIEKAGTIEFWFRPEACHGGLVAWTPSGSWPDMRLAAAFMTYRSGGKHADNGPLLMLTANGALHSFHPSVQPERDTWQHYAIVFDDSALVLYENGVRRRSSPLGTRPNLKGVPLWIGKCLGLGKLYFRGLMDDIRIYNRPIMPSEVAAHYKQQAKFKDKDLSLSNRPALRLQPVPEPGWILAVVNHGLMQPLPDRTRVEVTLHRHGSRKAEQRSTAPANTHMQKTRLVLDTGRLAAGTYEVRAILRDAKGATIGESAKASVEWPGQPEAFKKVKILNNLVWELLDKGPGRIRGRKTYEFINPTDRWAHVELTADIAQGGTVRVSLDAAEETKDIIVLDGTRKKTREAMRFLPAGKHTITLATEGPCRIEKLRVRAIAELIFQYGHNSHVTPFEKYIPDFAAKHILPQINTLVVRRYWLDQPFAREWTQQGGRIIYACLAPRPPKGKPRTVESSVDFIAKTAGYTHPLAAGIIADEYGGSCPRCAIDAKAIRKLHATEQFKDKRFYPYAGGLYDGPEGREFMQAVMDTGGANAWKRYLPEADTEQLARDFLTSVMVEPGYEFRRLCPGSIPCVIPCIGYFSAPPEFCDVNPSVNYKTFLDMQFHTIATDPVFFGCRGYMTYGISYTDEEIARWGAKMFRHYGIEGNTERATDDPYMLTHVSNRDFADGITGWTLRPAEEGTVRAVHKLGFGWHQGRFPRTDRGDTALLMVRSVKKPNIVTQQIRNLKPGKLYSLRMYTGDYKDMSRKEKHAVTIEIENVELIPKKCFTHVFRNYPGHSIPGPTRKQAQWMNYYWRIFRAKGNTAKLTLCDWASEKAPGGAIGQELMFNFVQVQPYIED